MQENLESFIRRLVHQAEGMEDPRICYTEGRVEVHEYDPDFEQEGEQLYWRTDPQFGAVSTTSTDATDSFRYLMGDVHSVNNFTGEVTIPLRGMSGSAVYLDEMEDLTPAPPLLDWEQKLEFMRNAIDNGNDIKKRWMPEDILDELNDQLVAFDEVETEIEDERNRRESDEEGLQDGTGDVTGEIQEPERVIVQHGRRTGKVSSGGFSTGSGTANDFVQQLPIVSATWTSGI